MSMTVPNPFGLSFSDGQKKFPAALLTSRSTEPSSATTRLTAAPTASLWRTSATIPRHRLPVDSLISLAAALMFSSLRLAIATSAPKPGKCQANPAADSRRPPGHQGDLSRKQIVTKHVHIRMLSMKLAGSLV